MVIHVYMPALSPYNEPGNHRVALDTRVKDQREVLRDYLLTKVAA